MSKTNPDRSSSEPYERRFLTLRDAERYEQLYHPGSYDWWVSQHERSVLRRLIGEWSRTNGRAPRLLDFACGSGRVLEAVDDLVAHATGVDVSEAMLTLAQARAPRARLILGDPVRVPSLLDGTYDIITSFRFFLNAGDELRRKVLRVLRSYLAPDGLLIANIHGNAWSLRWPSATVRRHLMGDRRVNQLSPRSAARMFEREAFQVQRRIGVGLLTPRSYRLVGVGGADWLDRLARHLRLDALCVDQIFVCALDG